MVRIESGKFLLLPQSFHVLYIRHRAFLYFCLGVLKPGFPSIQSPSEKSKSLIQSTIYNSQSFSDLLIGVFRIQKTSYGAFNFQCYSTFHPSTDNLRRSHPGRPGRYSMVIVLLSPGSTDT